MPDNTMAKFRKKGPLQDRAKNQITPMIAPEHRNTLSWRMFLRMAAHQLEGKEFNADSLVTALMTFACAGVLPNKYLHHGYLIPYKGVVTPVFGYQGLVHLAYRARGENGAALLDVSTGLVLRDDEYEDGSDDEIVKTHRVRTERDPRKHPKDDLILAYARFRYGVPIGGQVHEYERIQVSRPGEIRAIDTGRNVWKSHPQRMIEKTPIRRACASGRVQLAYMAGMALSAEGQAAGGNLAGYAQTVQGLAAQQGVEHDIAGIVDIEPAPEWSASEYLKRVAPIHALLKDETTTRKAAEGHIGRLSAIAKEMGAPDGFRDDIALDAWALIEKESAD